MLAKDIGGIGRSYSTVNSDSPSQLIQSTSQDKSKLTARETVALEGTEEALKFFWQCHINLDLEHGVWKEQHTTLDVL